MTLNRINTMQNIETFATEYSINDWLKVAAYEDFEKLNWMKIFNSKIELSSCFISRHVKHIQWESLLRILPEPILERFQSRVVHWNVHLYGCPLTYEFLIKYQDRFDWIEVSNNPPQWFGDIHYVTFGSEMDWKKLTNHYASMSVYIINRFAAKLDWEWISANDIRSEAFAIRHIFNVNWDHPQLHVNCLSTEFLYDLYEIRCLAYSMKHSLPLPDVHPRRNRLIAYTCSDIIQGFDPSDSPRIGGTIGLKFAFDQRDEFDWHELNRNGLITDSDLVQLKNRHLLYK